MRTHIDEVNSPTLSTPLHELFRGWGIFDLLLLWISSCILVILFFGWQKLKALKKRYEDIIIETRKEASARIMMWEQKALWYQRELQLAKQEALHMQQLRLQQVQFSFIFSWNGVSRCLKFHSNKGTLKLLGVEFTREKESLGNQKE